MSSIKKLKPNEDIGNWTRHYKLITARHEKVETFYENTIASLLCKKYPELSKKDAIGWSLDLRVYSLKELLKRLDNIYKNK